VARDALSRYSLVPMEPADLRAVAQVSRRERARIALAWGKLMDEPDKVGALRDAVRALDRVGRRAR
jgi:hypothetical protein